MIRYANPDSGVNAYEPGADFIITRFGKHYYLYSHKITGAENVKHMKALAEKGKGLSSFISRVARKNFEAMFETERDLRKYLRKRP